jgi:hypothetical protein
VGGNVVFNIGTVNAGAGPLTVFFRVYVHTPDGGTVQNNNYTIEGDGIPPITGPPVTTHVTASEIVLCHKCVITIQVPVNSLEYRRHIDHGDVIGECGGCDTPKQPAKLK